MNELIFITHTIIITCITIGAFMLGKEALVGFICIQSILANLFVTKQITLFGLHVTASDVYAVSALLSLNILQEFFGKTIAKKTIAINFFVLLFYLIMTQIHIWYAPNIFDQTHNAFTQILHVMPRITIASIATYLLVQLCDTQLYYFLKKAFAGKYLVIRNITSLACSQLLDTVLFSFLGLYGIVGSITHVIIVSFCIKLLVIASSTPFIALTKVFRTKYANTKSKEIL